MTPSDPENEIADAYIVSGHLTTLPSFDADCFYKTDRFANPSEMPATMGGPPLIPIVPPNETYNRPGEYTHGRKSNLPQVDMERAARLRPSRLRGRALTAMVTFVAGTGFILFGRLDVLRMVRKT